MFRVLTVAGLALSLTACATMPAPPPPPPPPLGAISADGIPYTCDNGTTFTVSFSQGSALVTMADGSQMDLPQQPSGSGIWYSNGKYEFRGKGAEATWTVGRMMPINCHTD